MKRYEIREETVGDTGYNERYTGRKYYLIRDSQECKEWAMKGVTLRPWHPVSLERAGQLIQQGEAALVFDYDEEKGYGFIKPLKPFVSTLLGYTVMPEGEQK